MQEDEPTTRWFVKQIMKLWYDKRLADPMFYGQIGIRNGKKVTSKNVKKFGKRSELLKVTDDPVAYVKEQIRMINEKEKTGQQELTLQLDFNEKITSDLSRTVSPLNTRNIGYFYLQHIYRELDVKTFFNNTTENSRISFDPDLVNRFLVYDRVLDPGSKLHTFHHKEWYYEEPDLKYQNIMKTMDLLQQNYCSYISWLFKKSGKIVKRDTSRCYYDCTNFYFEKESPDDDYVDEVTGEILPGLCEYGHSKENRPNPIVEMGLFMDRQGIPLSMCIHPGNSSEQITAVPLEKEMIKMFQEADKDNDGSFIYVADGGLGSASIRLFNSMGGRCFIVTQSIKKMSEKMQEAVFNDFDYWLPITDKSTGNVTSVPVSIESLKSFDKTDKKNLTLYNSYAYKVINADSLIDLGFTEEKLCKNGKIITRKVKGTLKQKIIIRFSRKMMEYQRAVRNRQVERAKAKLGSLDPDTYKKGPNDVTRFIKKTTAAKDGGAVKTEFSLDTDKIAEEEKYDGYYAYATNLEIGIIKDETDPTTEKPNLNDVLSIVSVASKRDKIEECFRIMKTNFNGRPVYHWKREHIIAHFMICYTALLVYRLLELKLNEGRFHCTTQDIIETLKHMEVGNVEDLYYQSLYGGSKTLTALSEAFDAKLDMKRYYPKVLNKTARSF
ncbi:MAG: transposase [Lachnospiraceae bacterium]|nr:transposase [Lachnospiraceae bacterium]